MAKIDVNCPQCGKNYLVLGRHLGREVTCHDCRQSFVLESSQEVQPVPRNEQKTVNQANLMQDSMESTARKRRQDSPSAKRPKKTDRFEIIEELGSGAFGIVYKARDKRLDRVVALKIPRFGSLGLGQDTQRFLREARAAGNLQHPNIVPIYDAGEYAGSHFIASGFIEGKTIEQMLAGSEQFTHRQSALIVEKLASALAHAHSQGVVHRDIKPANIMIDTQGEPQIMDFGMARRDEDDILKTQEGMRIGTPAYMSPEQHAGQSHLADSRSDQWALGVMLYELLTGQRPFQAPSTIQMAYTVRMSEAESPRKIDGTVDRDLETICLKCLQKQPSDRYPSCSSLANELHRWSQGEPIYARPIGPIERTWRWCKRNPAWIVGSAMTGLLLLLLISLFSRSPIPDAEFRLEPIEDQRILINEEFSFRARLTDPKAWENRVRFELTEGEDSGARIDADSGTLRFVSRSTESYRFDVRAVNLEDDEQCDAVSFQVDVLETVPAPILDSVQEQIAAPGDEIHVTATVANRDVLPCPCRLELVGPSSDASIDAETGEFIWKVALDQQAGRHPITIRAVADWPGEPSATTTFLVRVLGGNDLLFVEPVDDLTAKPNEELRLRVNARDRRPEPRKLAFHLVNAPDGAQLDIDSGEFSWTPGSNQGGRSYDFAMRIVTAPPGPLQQELPLHISVETPPPPVVVEKQKPPPPPVAEPFKPEMPWKIGEPAILIGLKRPTSFEFQDTPLQEVLETLSLKHGVPIFLDQRALDDIGMSSDTPVTLKSNRQPLGKALTSMLKQIDLGWMIQNEIVYIPTPEEDSVSLWTRVYRMRLPRNPAQIPIMHSNFFNDIQSNTSNYASHAQLRLQNAAIVIVLDTMSVHASLERRYAGRCDLVPIRVVPIGKPPLHGKSTPEEALNQVAEFDFVKTPLETVMAKLSERHRVPIRIDEKALQEVGIETDTPITFRLGEVRLRSGLTLLVREMDLTYLVKIDSLEITSREAADDEMITKSYPVRDLVGGNIPYFMNALQSMASAYSWDSVGGLGSMRSSATTGKIIVTNSQSAHESLEELLTQLRIANQ